MDVSIKWGVPRLSWFQASTKWVALGDLIATPSDVSRYAVQYNMYA